MNKNSLESEENKLFEKLFTLILEQQIETMMWENKNLFRYKTSEEVEKLALKRLKRMCSKGLDFLPLMDHTSNFLKHARKSMNSGDMNCAALFYATYFEHRINNILGKVARRKLSESHYQKIMRRADIEDKCSWVMHLLSEKSISKLSIKRIKKISEIRNSFVHYKWKPNIEHEKNEMALKDTDKIVRYLNRFEERIFFSGNRKNIPTLVKISR